jgi:hypothetical protein
MGALDPDAYQEILAAPDVLDGVPVHLTRYQVQKCAAIIMAGQVGHITFAEETRNVAQFLQAVAFEAGGIPFGTLPQSAAAIWQELNALPWPLPGPPKD